MNIIATNKLAQGIERAINTIMEENQRTIGAIEYKEIAIMLTSLTKTGAIFVMGAGRTGLMMKAGAMRLMHLGYKVYVVGETTTPAISAGDFLMAGSGSGTTSGIVKAAETARKVGAKVLCFTTNGSSPLGTMANYSVIIPAAQKQERDEGISKQYAGSLFEQSLLLVLDALIQTLWEMDGSEVSELWKRHANME